MTDEWGQTGAQRDRGGVRRLQRRTDHRVVAGVAGGFADYTSIPPWVVRLAFVGLTFAGGAGVLLYVAGWLLMPAEGEEESIAQAISHRALAGPAWAGALLLFIGAALLANHALFIAPAIVWGLGFIGLGIYLFFRADQAGREPTPGPGSWASSETGTSRVESAAAASAVAAPGIAPPPPPPPPGTAEAASSGVAPVEPGRVAVRRRPARERSLLGWFVLGLMLAAVGVLGFLDEIGAVSPRPVVYAALALTVVGAGLLVSAWVGRARWLIAVALLLAALTAALSPIRVPIEGGFGDRFYAPVASAATTSTYRLVAGQMTVDLRALGTESPAPTVTASVVAGRLRVFVPADVTVAISGHVSTGVATVFGRSISGRNLDLAQLQPVSATAPEVVLNLAVTYGDVLVTHVPSDSKLVPAIPSPPGIP